MLIISSQLEAQRPNGLRLGEESAFAGQLVFTVQAPQVAVFSTHVKKLLYFVADGATGFSLAKQESAGYVPTAAPTLNTSPWRTGIPVIESVI